MKNAPPRAKMSKKDRKALDGARRARWNVQPVTRVRESGKRYRRLKKEEYDG